MDYRLILSIIRPGATYRWTGDATGDKTDIVWLDQEQIEPTDQEYADGWVLAQIELANQASQDTVQTGAKNAFSAVPGLATATGAEAEAWINANVTDLASAKVAITHLVKMIIALRNDRWPNIEAGG
ncbi:MAG: hypothetical protein OEY86_20420 [Nitrospira sp.]|nr:hypothetical protein [Nitrospira sp.]